VAAGAPKAGVATGAANKVACPNDGVEVAAPKDGGGAVVVAGRAPKAKAPGAAVPPPMEAFVLGVNISGSPS